MPTRLAVIALALVLGLAACGPNGGSGAPPSSTASATAVSGTVTPTTPCPACPTPTPAPTAGPPVNGVLTLTEADYGRTIAVPRGTHIEVRLSAASMYAWSAARSSDTNVVAPAPGIYSPAPGGLDALFIAVGGGQATLSASADPICAQSRPPCMIPSRLWQVTIAVSG